MPVRAARRSAAEWVMIIDEYRAGSENDATFCQQRGLNLATFRKHKYGRTRVGRVQHKSQFRAVTISGVAPIVACITVSGPDGVKVELPPTVSMDSVAQLAKALSHGR